MQIWEILMGYGPILFTSAVIGTVLSLLAPEIIRKLKLNFKNKQVLDLHRQYKANPSAFAAKHPDLAEFFAREGWDKCHCHKCRLLHKKVKKLAKAK